MTEVHEGSCHCGAVTYAVETSLDGLIECHCSHCYRKGFVLAFAPKAAFTLKSGEDQLGEYRFNKHNIAHMFCKTCGVQPFGFGTGPDGSEMAAVNVRTLTDIEPWSWTAERVDGRSF